MKALLLLLFTISTMIMMERNKIFAREEANILAELSNAISSRSNSRTEREKKISKGFEWIIQGVNILDQVDNFISDRTKNIIRKLHTAYNEDNSNTYGHLGQSLKRNY